ncbi:von Willebrand domain-containing protein, partial [Colletotrichum zoysiae]
MAASNGPGPLSQSSSQQLPTPASPIQPDVSDECLPLLKVSAEVLVDGNVARTSLSQRFSNTSKESIDEARYTFPLYDSAVVVAFTCTIGEEKEITGKVQARDEARKSFKKAVDKLETAALLEEHTPEIFETVIGNIPAKTYVSVQVEYVHELKASIIDDGEEVLEAIIPMSIAPRYGGLGGVEQRTNSDTKMNDEGLEIVVKVSDSIKVKRIHCNHCVDIEENVPVTSTRVASLFELGKAKEKEPTSTATGITQTIARYASYTAIMDEDFIISIENHPSHPIRSRAVLSPPDEDGHAALMVSLKTAEVFKNEARADRFDGEIIFLLDRSGSMDDLPSSGSFWRTFQRNRSKISTLREAMSVSLASLPKTCHFNIVSFGNDTELLWKQSKPYTQHSLDYARNYSNGLRADLGGTNLCHALKGVVDSRRSEATSTQIILVTDGEVEPEDVLVYVWEARQKLGDKIRFFALGIGYNVPHRLINKIGDFGGGYGEVVDIKEKPQWADRLSLMLSSGIMPKTWTCEIDLGPGFERQSLLCQEFGKNSSEKQEYAKSKVIPFIQAPYPMPPLHPFAFRSIYFLIDVRAGDAPTQVILKATADQTKVKSEHTLLIEKT